MNWLTFWISALATYRISIMISRELGPWEVFKKLRSIDKCSKLLKCPYCVSVYIGSLICVGLWLSGIELPWPIWIILLLSFSSVTIMADRFFTSDLQT